VTVPPVLYGHRGAPTERPENTLISFERAVELGVTALETDVHMTSDERIVISHDASAERSADQRAAIRDSTWAEVCTWDVGWQYVAPDGSRPFAGQGLRMPGLDDVLKAFPDLRINIDVKQKHPAMVQPLLATIRAHDAEERVTLASFASRTMREIRAAGFQGRTVLGRNEVLALLLLPESVAKRFVAGDSAQVPTRAGLFNLGSQRFVDKCHALGLRVEYWTVNDAVEAERLLGLGADGIMTDDPASIAPVFMRHHAA
jgi:glycerophosphoryl diester phosphodiesterase